MGTTKTGEKTDAKKHVKSGDARVELARRLLAELIGTFALTFIAAGCEVAAVLTNGGVSEAARAVAPALVIMAMTYTFGGQSGAHFNPGVTLAFALRRDFPWTRVAFYWIAQFAGAILAALLLRLLFGLTGHVGANQPHAGVVISLVIEIVLTFFLITVILGTATDSRIVGHNAALAVGGTIALAGLFGEPLSGASMNTARSLGPALLDGDLSTIWIYIVGPLAGALLAVAFAYLLRGRTTSHAVEVAKGD
jgi:aquaporin Z